MTDPLSSRLALIKELLAPTPQQRIAAGLDPADPTLGLDLVVTAGAGSGKTRTLTGRYLALLAQGHAPPHIVAITFTKKAAREMRNRIRSSLNDLAGKAPPAEQAFWLGHLQRMDAAHIGTIHSLCAEILRAHPAEAGLDPRFETLDEGQTTLLQARVVEESLVWLMEETVLHPLLDGITPEGLRKLAKFALARRLDLSNIPAVSPTGVIKEALNEFFALPEVSGCAVDLQQLKDDGELVNDAGEKLAPIAEEFLARWETVDNAWQAGELYAALKGLYGIRRNAMAGRYGSRTSRAKAALKAFQDAYDEHIDPWVGGKKSGDKEPDWNMERRVPDWIPLARTFCEGVIARYKNRLAAMNALDFDDLEEGALRLLRDFPQVRQRWQGECAALLVDEFQDTNQRQQEIILLLRGSQPGRVFVVGDDRQSIYRFRGADVTVFRDMQEKVIAWGGKVIDLQETFRTHQPLLEAMDAILQPAMQPPAASRPYWVPFTPVRPRRTSAPCPPPHLEIWLGVKNGSDDDPRAIAAGMLAERLLALRSAGEIQRWDDVALLFRASTGFPAWEDALDAAGIPYVTVAGRGFFDRPEVRDVLNLLRAVANPWDDTSLAGLLRSPAFGLPDAGLYVLRQDGLSLYQSLQASPEGLPDDYVPILERAREFIALFHPQAGKVSVGQLLEDILDWTDYVAILAATQTRMERNITKLLETARENRGVTLDAFLELVDELRDVGAREGEAQIEARGAVQLMTVHKAKGLEFPIVVLADAGYGGNTRSDAAYLFPQTGLTPRFDRLQGDSLLFNLAKILDQDQQSAERARLLYVGMTRAKDRLIINGHAADLKEAWIRKVSEAAGLDWKEVKSGSLPEEIDIGKGCKLRLVVQRAIPDFVPSSLPSAKTIPDTHLGNGDPLYPPYPGMQGTVSSTSDEEAFRGPEEAHRPWRVTGKRHAPAVVVGEMVHRAIEQWLPPDDPRLLALWAALAYDEGLITSQQQEDARREADRLYRRFWEHPLRQEIEGAAVRFHEFPYAVNRPNSDHGAVDLLYQDDTGWHILDFKTDDIRDDESLESCVEEYRPQLERYREALTPHFNPLVDVRICFLNVKNEVILYPV